MAYKRHPKFKDLLIKNDGSEFILYGEALAIRTHQPRPKNTLKVVSIDGAYYSAPRLVLETYGEEKPEGRCYALYKDGNKDNMHPNNLYWSSVLKISAKNRLKYSIEASKLTKMQTYDAYFRYNENKEPLASIAKEYGVSDMIVHRAIKRYKKYLETLKKHQ